MEGAARGLCSGVARNSVTTVHVGGEGRGSERPMQQGVMGWQGTGPTVAKKNALTYGRMRDG